MSQNAPHSLDAARAAVDAACDEAERLLAQADALREAGLALRRRFERQGVGWEDSPECYSFEKALRPLAERLYELSGTLFRLCHDYGCTVFEVQSWATRAVNTIGERAMDQRAAILDAGFGEEPEPWKDRHPQVRPADARTGLPSELRDLPSLRWADEDGIEARQRSRQRRQLVAAAFLLLGAAGASVSGIRSPADGGVGTLFALCFAASGGWLVGGLITAAWRRLRRYRLMRRPSMRILARFQRTC